MYFDEPETIRIGVQIMRVMVLIVLMQVAQVIYMGCLRGAGDVRFTTMPPACRHQKKRTGT